MQVKQECGDCRPMSQDSKAGMSPGIMSHVAGRLSPMSLDSVSQSPANCRHVAENYRLVQDVDKKIGAVEQPRNPSNVATIRAMLPGSQEPIAASLVLRFPRYSILRHCSKLRGGLRAIQYLARIRHLARFESSHPRHNYQTM